MGPHEVLRSARGSSFDKATGPIIAEDGSKSVSGPANGGRGNRSGLRSGWGSPHCLTDEVTKDDPPLTPRNRSQRQIVIFGPIAAVLVWLLVISDYSHGAIHTLGLVLGLPIMGLLLLVALRFYRSSR